MDQKNRERAEAWLRYADDIGLGPFYMSRTIESERALTANSISASSSKAALAAAGRSSAQEPAATSKPISKPAATAEINVEPPTVIPVLAPTLFDERIEGDTLESIRADIGSNCTRCKLHKGRTKIVFGVGNPKAELVFVGEGPGRDEDAQGEPFVGRAGKLLTQMIEAMGLRREDVYIANVVKCRPPENRLPEKDEIETCSPYLMRQLAVIQPKVICCLGSCSSQTLLQTTQGISRFRGEWFDFRGSKLIATYHPAYLLRNPAAKSEVWKDLQKVMVVLGLKPKRR